MNIKQLKNIFVLFLCMGTITSCFDEHIDLLPEADTGALPIVSNITNDGIFNLLDIGNAGVGFTINIDENSTADVASVIVNKSFNGGDLIEQTTVSSFPAQINIPVADAVSGTGIGVGDLEVGDLFDFTFDVVTTDGRTLKNGVLIQVPASCPSNLAGVYMLHSEVLFADNGPQTYDYEITLEGSGTYALEDVTGGAWGINYAALYGTSPRAGTLVDICDNLSIAPVSDQFGFEIVVTDLAKDADGVISYKWNDTGYDDNGEVTLTPQ